jgi:UDP-glucose 4-epimerase
MKYFVTGGAGFIGSHLVDRLVATGEVTVYDNLNSGKTEFIEQHLSRANFQLVQADLLEPEDLQEAMKGHDVVFHLAANSEARASIEDTDIDLKQGTIATYNILEAMKLASVKKIVFASSSTVYGEAKVKPTPEDYGPLEPISLYGASKLAAEGLITAFCHTFEMQSWIFRFANVIGARSTHGVVFDFINKLKKNKSELEILGDGIQEKPYIHVVDCVAGFLYGFQHARERVNIFNLGTASSSNVSSIARVLVEEMGLSDVVFKFTGGDRGWPGDVPQVRYDTLKMERLGWKPGYTSDEAVRRGIKDILGKPD